MICLSFHYSHWHTPRYDTQGLSDCKASLTELHQAKLDAGKLRGQLKEAEKRDHKTKDRQVKRARSLVVVVRRLRSSCMPGGVDVGASLPASLGSPAPCLCFARESSRSENRSLRFNSCPLLSCRPLLDPSALSTALERHLAVLLFAARAAR